MSLHLFTLFSLCILCVSSLSSLSDDFQSVRLCGSKLVRAVVRSCQLPDGTLDCEDSEGSDEAFDDLQMPSEDDDDDSDLDFRRKRGAVSLASRCCSNRCDYGIIRKACCSLFASSPFVKSIDNSKAHHGARKVEVSKMDRYDIEKY